MNEHFRILQPVTPHELEQYYQVRYEVLRKPWKQSVASTKDEQESNSLHFLCVTETGKAVATGRLQFNSPTEAQVRSMAVLEDYRTHGLGSKMLLHLEQKAKERKVTDIVLDARENAVKFYEKNGYRVVGLSYLLFGLIQHYKMKKTLD